MLNRIINVLKKNGIQTWRATEIKTHTAEAYFIKQKLDIPRYKELNQYHVTVFHDFEKNGKACRGDSTALISPGMSDSEIEEKIKCAYMAAGFVANPFYELADPVKEDKKESTSDLAKYDVKDVVLKFAEAIFSVDTEKDAFVNSLEIFAKRAYERIVASNGLDVSFDFDVVDGEYVTQCITPTDVEQYRQFNYNCLALDDIKERVKEAIEDVRARAKASEMPSTGNYDIILSGENLEEIFEYYGARSTASLVFPGYSEWKVGDNVQCEDVVGEKLNLSFEAVYPYSSEGIPLPPRDLVTDGKLDLIYGSTRFCRYLGIEPTGDYSRLICKNGSMNLADMRKDGVLEAISFSDFQMDYMDGHFKGEIRLAYLYHKDGSKEILTGGSINGSIIELQKNIHFSKEHYESLSYSGPLAILIPGVAVAGK